MRPYVNIGLLIALIVILSAIFAGIYLFNKGPVDTGSIKPDFAITAVDLQREFSEDEAAASKKYINKIIEVKGNIATVDKTEGNNINISLKTGDEMSSVICTVAVVKGSGNIKPGDEITVRGVCSGFLMDVLLNNCSIISH
jgi:hypothetical protein